jgi:cytochrome c
MGRKVGKVPGFTYSPGLAAADWAWDEGTLDKWLTDPHELVADTFMMYKQDDPAVRSAIVKYLASQK